jgi:hypothetical protein
LSRIKAGMSRGCAARTLKEGFCILGILTPSAGYAFDPDPISLNRIRAWIFTWSMILSETGIQSSGSCSDIHFAADPAGRAARRGDTGALRVHVADCWRMAAAPLMAGRLRKVWTRSRDVRRRAYARNRHCASSAGKS